MLLAAQILVTPGLPFDLESRDSNSGDPRPAIRSGIARFAVRHSVPVRSSFGILKLGNGGLSGAFPDAVGSWTSVEMLNIFSNKMAGSLPGAVGSRQKSSA